MAEAPAFLTGKRLLRFEALQRDLVPRAAAFDDAARAASRRLVDDLVGAMPAVNQRKLGLFLAIIDLLAFFFGLRPYRALPEARRLRLLAWLFDAPVGLLRKGFWGLNSLARLGVYGNPAIWPEIGYAPREHKP